MADRFSSDPRADLLAELERVTRALRTATINRASLLWRHDQLLAQLQQIARAS